MKRLTLFILFVLIGLTVSGLNDYISKKFDQEEALSGVILLSVISLAILTMTQGIKLLYSKEVRLWLAVFVLFLLLATFSTLFLNDGENLAWGFRYYLPSVLIYLAGLLGFHFAFRRSGENTVLNLLRWTFLANTLTVLLAYFFDLDIFVVSGDRASGINLNANAAGYIGVIALAFELFLYYRDQKWLHFLWLTLILFGIFVTFSKSAYAMALGIVSLFVYYSLIGKNKGWRIYQIMSLAILAVLAVYYINNNIQLTGVQQDRIQQFGALLSGEFTTESTTNRSDLAQIGWEKVMSSPIFGSGFGEMLRLGRDTGGVHNQYLLLWGEAGLLAMLAFIYLLVSYAKKANSLPLDYRFLLQALLFAIGFYSLTNHNMYSSKSLMLILAFMALIFKQHRYVRNFRPTRSRPQLKR